MLRVVALSAGSAYVLYLEREAVEEAYWVGRGAELLQLEWHKVRAEELGLLARGVDPKTQERLKPEHRQTRGLYDAVVHAPKSVSLMGMVDERLVSVHRMATFQTMHSMEELSSVYAGGETRPSQNLLMAAYEHSLSRAQDVHLHTHIAVPNLSYDTAEGQWKTLRAGPIFRNRHNLTEEYRMTLARRAESLGYRIADKQSVGFEIEGVAERLIEKFSQRSTEIQKVLSEGYREVTVANVARLTREDKKELSPAQIREAQFARLTPAEHRQLVTLREQAMERQGLREKHRFSLQDHVDFEPERHRQRWDYGERPKEGIRHGF